MKTSIGRNTVTMKNTIARAAQSLGLTEKRIITLGISKIDSRQSKTVYKDETKRTITITASEYQTIANLKRELDAYKELQAGTEKIGKKQLTIKTETMRGKKITRINWIEQATYEQGRGKIKICFTTKIMPYLCAIENRFTTYKINDTAGIKSIYAWRLMEFLISWSAKKEGQRTITIKNIQEMLEIPTSYETGGTIARIIKPAITELEKRNWRIKYETEKTGRKITHITFSWRKP
ncbi:replication initiation protein [Thiolapillus sp.]|uniref:replication initiation protein n=2 Tax=Thiolapillus sp. TaxID=2017437 RepID=UPI003AF8F80D